MKAIMDYLHTHAPKTADISLMADHGTPHFYRRYGFNFAEIFRHVPEDFLRHSYRNSEDVCCVQPLPSGGATPSRMTSIRESTTP